MSCVIFISGVIINLATVNFHYDIIAYLTWPPFAFYHAFSIVNEIRQVIDLYSTDQMDFSYVVLASAHPRTIKENHGYSERNRRNKTGLT